MDWKNILSHATPYVKQALEGIADNVMPTCDECGEMGLPIRCLGCQSFVCLDHAFVNYATREIICIECAGRLDGAKPKRRKRQPKQQSGASTGYPWNVLGIPPNSSEEIINKAFRQKAAKCHPDKGGSKEAFNKLNDAKEVAIKITRGGI